MDIRDNLLQTGKMMREKSEMIHKRLRTLPKGSIQIVNDQDYLRISQIIREDGKLIRIGLKRKPEIARLLASKEFYREYVRRLDRNADILREAFRKLENMDDSSIIRALPANFDLLPNEYRENWMPSYMNPVFDEAIPARVAELYVPENEQTIWPTRAYRANRYKQELMRYRTIEGVKMRSKSEVAIFDIYRNLGIMVHYDELLLFNGTLKSPDFIGMRYDGKLIIHEHCGRVNDKEYMKAHDEKMSIYEKVGFVPWDNVIVTYDDLDGGLDLRLAEAEIRSKFKL